MCSSLRSHFGRLCVCGQLRSTSSFMTITTKCCGGTQHRSAIWAFNTQNVLTHKEIHPCLPIRSTTPVICANICWMTLAVISTQCQSSIFQTIHWHVRSVSINIHSGLQRRDSHTDRTVHIHLMTPGRTIKAIFSNSPVQLPVASQWLHSLLWQ